MRPQAAPDQMFESNRTSLGEIFPVISSPNLCPQPCPVRRPALHHLLYALGGPAVLQLEVSPDHVTPLHPLHLVLPGHLVTGSRPDPAGVDVTDVRSLRAI